ncbi:MAG: hypothetical protein HGA67_00875 [Candidatus Yonathbacteria bacterium]|nr:hypothetical protein [Candidatus Yonathbacteria bacterium]
MARAPRAIRSSSVSSASRRGSGTSSISTKSNDKTKKTAKRGVSLKQRRVLVPMVPRKKVSSVKKISLKKPSIMIKKKKSVAPKTSVSRGVFAASVSAVTKQKPRLQKDVSKRKVIKRPTKDKEPRSVARPPVASAHLLKHLERYEGNPIIMPRDEYAWESWQTFNPGAVLIDGKIHLFYRAMGADGQSRIGHAVSEDAYTIDERADMPVYEHATVRPFTMNPVGFASGGGWAGAEDPRVVYIPEDGCVYLTYTACDGGLKMGVSSISVEDIKRKRWNWSSPSIMSHPHEYHKNWMIFPEKFAGKYAVLHSISPNILIEYVDSLSLAEEEYIPSHHFKNERKNEWDTWVRGPAAPPIRTDDGWLVFYHAVTHDEPWKYKVGVMLLDLEDPTKVVHRASGPVLVPTEEYEYNGAKGGIVYVSGVVLKDNMLYVYYGASDNYACVASANFETFMEELRKDAMPKMRTQAVVKKKIRSRR